MIFCTLLLGLILMTAPAEAMIVVTQSDPRCSTIKCGQAEVSPGRWDLNLGADFPNFNSVKLSYPNSSVLTNSTGDLLFTVKLTVNSTTAHRDINAGNLVVPNAAAYSSVDIYIPPDFTGLSISKVWTSFTNSYDGNSLSVSKRGSTDQIAPGWWKISVQHIIVTNNLGFASINNGMLVPNRVFVANQTQYVRLLSINSPVTAGRYFFKVFMNGTSIGAANFPTLVVKGSRDPAYISGTLRDEGNLDSAMSGKPIDLPAGFGAQILATGIDYLGRSATAQAFINSTADGRYTLFGVAPGTYNVTAYAAGFVPTTRPTRISVFPGQSLLGIDFLLPHSVNVTGIVLSVDAEGNPVPWGPVFGFGGTPTNRSIAISLHSVNGTQTASTPAPYRPTLFTDIDATSFRFTIQREIGYDGRIPQDFANYTSGLSSGDYYLRAYATSYIQFDDVYMHVTNDTIRTYSIVRLVRSGFFDITVHFRDNNSSLIESPLNPPYCFFACTLSVSAYDQQGVLRGSNTTSVPVGSLSATLEIIGTSNTRSFGLIELLPASSGLYPGTYHIIARLTPSPIFTGFANIGVVATYYQLDDIQGTIGLPTPVNAPTHVSLSMYRGGGINLTLLSVDDENPAVEKPWTFPGAVVTFKIIDPLGNVFQGNSTQHDGSHFTVFLRGFLPDDYIIIVESLGYSQRVIATIPVVLGAISDTIIRMTQEPIIDLSLTFKTEHMFSPIDSTQPFAQPLNHIDATPIRIEVYDDSGNFVAADATYIPNLTNGVPTTLARFLLAGFDSYFGDPKNTWSGFYDTTDGSRQDEGGLIPGNYQILVWVDGYYQTEEIHVTLHSRQTASLVYSMERASRISGVILGPDINEKARPLSWATITLEPMNASFTTFSLDGDYQLWTPSGSYKIGVSLPGYSTRTANLSVPTGSDLHLDFWLPDYGAQQAPSLFLYTSNMPIAMANASTRTRAEGNSGIVWNAICAVAD